MDTTANGRSDGELHVRSQLFLLRVWPGDLPEKQDWQGRLQQTSTGESHYFKSCEELRHILLEIISPLRTVPPVEEPQPETD